MWHVLVCHRYLGLVVSWLGGECALHWKSGDKDFKDIKKSCEGPLFRRRHLFLISCSVSMVGCEQHKCTVAGLTLRPIQPTHLSAGTSTCSTEHCLLSKSTSNYFWPASLYSKYCFSEVQVCNESKYLLVIDISSAVGISGIRGGKDSFNFF